LTPTLTGSSTPSGTAAAGDEFRICHPRGALARPFAPDSRYRAVRNGVGVRADGTVVFAIADTPVTFHHFAAAFRDVLACPDALFLDGTISQLHAGPGNRLPPQRREFAAVFAVTAPAP
jgi:uncharacterized protein YigE (DUF2233 family)